MDNENYSPTSNCSTLNQKTDIEIISAKKSDETIHSGKNVSGSDKNEDTLQHESYWLDTKESCYKPNIVLSFNRDDILVRNIKPHDCRKLLIAKYGNRSSKIENEALHEIVRTKHDDIRERFISEFRSSFENICVRIAIEIGMRDGRCNYNYQHISKHVLTNPTYASICRLQFLLRGVFSNQIGWKLKIEKQMMKQLNMKYKDGFVSSLSENGCFLSIISHVIVQKHRDINRRLANKHNFILVQRSIRHREAMKNSRMMSENLSYFSLKRNLEFKGKNEEENLLLFQQINKSTPDTIKSDESEFNEVHYSLLENIVFPKGSLSRSNKIVAQWIGDLPSDMPMSPPTTTEKQTNLDELYVVTEKSITKKKK